MLEIVGTFLVGLVVGVLSGLLGIGGGMIMVPLFRLGFGLAPISATATSLFVIIPTSLAGLSKHLRGGTCVPRVGLTCGIAGACVSPLGVLAASHSPNWAIMGATGLIIAYSSTTMLRRGIAAWRAEAAGRAAVTLRSDAGAQTATEDVGLEAGLLLSADPAVQGGVDGGAARKRDASGGFVPGLSRADFSLRRFLGLVGIGLVAGFMGGYVGVGGGFIMVPLFVSVLGLSMRRASGTSLLAVCLLATPGVIEQILLGNVHFSLGLALAAGSMPGSILGAALVKRVPESILRLMFAGFLFVIAVILVVNELVG